VGGDVEVAIQRRPAHAQRRGDRVHRTVLVSHRGGGRELVRGDAAGTATMTPAGPAASRPARVRSLDEAALELGQRAEDVNDHAPGGVRGVHPLGQRPEADVALLEL
jgi:hypothetical protein